MNKNEKNDNKTEDVFSGANFTRMIIGFFVMAVVLIIAKFSPEISSAINRLLH